MEVIKKIYEASIHKLTLYFLGLLKKILKNRFSLWFATSSRFRVDSTSYLGFTELITNLDLDHLKFWQDPESPISRINLPYQAEF